MWYFILDDLWYRLVDGCLGTKQKDYHSIKDRLKISKNKIPKAGRCELGEWLVGCVRSI